MMYRDDRLLIDGEQLSVALSAGPDRPEGDLLFLHGAGMASLDRYRYISDFASGLAWRSVLFNFSGQGSSTGDLKQSSLRKRVNEAGKVISNYITRPSFSVVASSMGGYVALKLPDIYRVSHLILFCPAAYSIASFDLPFDERFSNEIRRPSSWLETDAFQIIQRYRGNLLIIAGTKDDVIPSGIIVKLYSHAINARSRQLLYLEDGPHALHVWLSKPEQNQQLEEVKNAIANCLSQSYAITI